MDINIHTALTHSMYMICWNQVLFQKNISFATEIG